MCRGAGPLIDEHVISKTVRKQLPSTARITGTFAGRSKTRGVLYCVIRKSVCHTCNRGWMRELEDYVVETIGPEIGSADRIRLDPLACERLATWAIKTGLLLEFSTSLHGNGAYVPTDNLRWLARHRTPPPRSKVWIAGIEYGRRYSWSQGMSLNGPSGNGVGVVTTFSVGSFGFQVLALNEEDGDDVELLRTLAAIEPPQYVPNPTEEIWPGDATEIAWPIRDRLLEVSAPSEVGELALGAVSAGSRCTLRVPPCATRLSCSLHLPGDNERLPGEELSKGSLRGVLAEGTGRPQPLWGVERHHRSPQRRRFHRARVA